MKNLLLVAAFIFGLSFQANAACIDCCVDCCIDCCVDCKDGDKRVQEAVAQLSMLNADDPIRSTMVLKVESVVSNENEAKRVRKALKSVQGVSSVNVCTESGTVTVAYDKAKTGCCSRIHSQLEQSGISFSVVSNEQPAGCAGRAAQTQEQGRNCTGQQNSQQGNRPACCRSQRNS